MSWLMKRFLNSSVWKFTSSIVSHFTALSSSTRILLVYGVSAPLFLVSQYVEGILFIEILKALTGFLSLIVVPGILWSNALISPRNGRLWSTILIGVLFDCILIQGLFFARLYWSLTVILGNWLVVFNSILVVVCSLSKSLGKMDLEDRAYCALGGGWRLATVLLVGLLIRALLGFFATDSIAPDASLYSDYARFILEGQFNTNVLIDNRIYDLGNGVRYCFHKGFIYLESISFLLAEPLRSGPTLMLMILGMCLILVIYDLSSRFFGKQAAIWTAGISALHPLLVFHSVVAYGPEISSLVFILAGVIFLTKKKQNGYANFLLGGAMIGFSDIIWSPNFLLFSISLPILLFLARSLNRRMTIMFSAGLLSLLMARIFFLDLSRFAVILGILTIGLVLVVIRVPREEVMKSLLFVGSMIGIILLWRGPIQLTEGAFNLGALGFEQFDMVRVLQLPNPPLHIFFRELSPTVIWRMIIFFIYQCTPILLFLSMVSLIFGKRRSVVLAFLLIGLVGLIGTTFVMNSLSGFKETLNVGYYYSDSRFFLSSVTLVMVSLGSIFQRLQTKPDFQSRVNYGRIRSYVERSRRNVIVLLIIGLGFMPGYLQMPPGLKLIEYESRYGWVNLGSSIQSMSDEDSIFIVDRATEFSWLTNRRTVKLGLPGRRISLDRALSRVRLQAESYQADYFIVDAYTVEYWQSFAEVLHAPLLLGQGIPIDIRDFDYVKNDTQSSSLILEYQTPPNQNGDYARVYRFGSLYFKRDTMVNLTDNGWAAGNNGNLTQAGGYPAIEIGGNENYTFTYRPSGFDLGLTATSGFLFLDFQETSAEVSRIEFYNTNGDFIGYSTDLGNGLHFHFVGGSILGDIRIIVEGNPEGYVIVEGVSIWGTS